MLRFSPPPLVLIHEADPQSRPVVIIVITISSVRPHFSKQNKFQAKENNVRYWRDCGPSGSFMTPVLFFLLLVKNELSLLGPAKLNYLSSQYAKDSIINQVGTVKEATTILTVSPT